jgi:hypothetical protein
MGFLRLAERPDKQVNRDGAEHGTPRMEHRIHSRDPTACRATMFWQDGRGRQRSARALVVEMSGTGTMVKSGTSIDPGSFVFIRFRELRLMGSAVVRHCNTGLLSYRIGLQFSSPLTYHF